MKLHTPSLKSALALASLTVLTFLSPAGAQLVSQYGILDLTANGGINPNTGLAWVAGDQYRLAFHTLGTITGTSNDPAVYDSFATAQAQENAALATSTGWTAMVWVNTDKTLSQAVNLAAPGAGESPISSPVVRSGTGDLTGGANQGGAGFPVFAMNGTTCIARNNADIYNSWSNPFENSPGVPNPTGSGTNTLRWASGTGPTPASQNVFYSPFLNQNGAQTVTPDDVHGKTTWTGGFSSAVNPLGDTSNEVRASNGNTNANTTGRIWNRFQADNTTSLGVYAISEPLTVSTGGPSIPFAITAFEFTLSAVPMVPSTVSLTWTSKPGVRYAVRYTSDLASWPGEFDDSATGDPDSATTTRSYPFDATMVAPNGQFFVRVERVP